MSHPRIDTDFYGSGHHGSPDVIIFAPHGDDGLSFLDEYPEIFDACSSPQNTILDFVSLERDHGTPELAQEIARTLTDVTHGKISSLVVVDKIPRAICDTNRETKVALRNIFSEEDFPDLASCLRVEQAQVLAEKFRILETLPADRGLFVEIHSMAAHSPVADSNSLTEAVRETQEGLAAYIEAYVRARERGGERRDIDIVTRVVPGNTLVADSNLTREIEERFRENRIRFRENHPYSTAPHIISTHLMQRRRGVTVDVPKDILSHYSAEHPVYDLVRPQLSSHAIENTAEPIALAVKNALARVT